MGCAQEFNDLFNRMDDEVKCAKVIVWTVFYVTTVLGYFISTVSLYIIIRFVD